MTDRAGAEGATAADLTAEGRRWLASIPSLVVELRAVWALEVDAAVQRRGFNAVVMPARREGVECVLKLDWPRDQVALEARALTIWDGDGAVRLLAADPPRGALLLERLDAGRSLRSVPIDEAASVAGRLIRALAVPAPDGFRVLRDVAAEIEGGLEERQRRLNAPVPTAWQRAAVSLAHDLGARSGESLVHGDLHYGNILAGAREPWLAIDPKPLSGDPEYAVPELLWTRADELSNDDAIRDLLAGIATAGSLRLDVARGWSIVRCVDYWLWGLEHGLTEDPVRCARVVGAIL